MLAIHPSVDLLEDRSTPSVSPTISGITPALAGSPSPDPASSSLISAPIGNNGGSSTTNAVTTTGPGASTMPGLPPGTNNPGSIYPNTVPGTTNLLPGPFLQAAPPNVPQPANPVLFNQFPTFSSAEVATNPFVRLTYNFGVGDGSFIDPRVPPANRAAPAPRVNVRVSQAVPVESAPALTSVELPAPDATVEAPPDE